MMATTATMMRAFLTRSYDDDNDNNDDDDGNKRLVFQATTNLGPSRGVVGDFYDDDEDEDDNDGDNNGDDDENLFDEDV